MKSLLLLVNSPLFAAQHLLPIIESLSRDYQVNIACTFNQSYVDQIKNAKVIKLRIERNPSLYDLLSFLRVVTLRCRLRPSVVISFTPKAGLLNSLTCLLPGISIHYFTGQRWATMRGIQRKLYMLIDKLIIRSASKVYCDSNSQAIFLASELNESQPRVIHNGSIKGVNLDRFYPRDFLYQLTERNILLKKSRTINLYSQGAAFCYVGRISEDKGINTLLNAFDKHLDVHPSSFLVLIGPCESTQILKLLQKLPRRIHWIQYTPEVHAYIPGFSALVLPSLREGFGSVVIEAAACKVPSIVTNIPGPTDFVDHQINGLIVNVSDIEDLQSSLDFIASDLKRAHLMGLYAYDKVLDQYSEKDVVEAFTAEISVIVDSL